MEPTLAQRFMLLLGRTFLDFIDIKRRRRQTIDEDTMLFAIKVVAYYNGRSRFMCRLCCQRREYIEILIGNQAHNSSEAIIAASIEAIISFGMIDRFKQQMLHPPKPKEERNLRWI